MRWLIPLALAATLAAQPVKLEFQCTPDDIHSAGLACSEEEPCEVYLELSAVEPVGAQIFIIGNIHSQAVTLYALLLASADGGKTWKEPIERIRDASLDHMRFADFEYGWISGQLLHPVPHDPFVIISNDGGKTWRRRPLFSDERAGTILQMWFESRTQGALTLDRGQSAEGMRYELYDSQTGGESWSIREANDKPLQIRRMPAVTRNTDWRIRADAPTKTFRVEKREGGRWQTVSSFLFKLDPCKPPERKLTEPEPEAEAKLEAGAKPEEKKGPGVLVLPADRTKMPEYKRLPTAPPRKK